MKCIVSMSTYLVVISVLSFYKAHLAFVFTVPVLSLIASEMLFVHSNTKSQKKNEKTRFKEKVNLKRNRYGTYE